MAYLIQFAESVKEQLKALTARQREIVLDAIEEQLVHEPLVETRNRKPLRPNPIAPWELRIGELRVFYDVEVREERTASTPVEEREESTVSILAVGEKQGNTLKIGGKEVTL